MQFRSRPFVGCARGVVALLSVTAFLSLAQAGPSQTMAAAAGPPVTPNRTVPKVEPPKTGLEFSANPTAEEIFRARVFAEPLVPIGVKPTADENSGLAAALVGYSQRNGPDDFSSLTGFLERHPRSPWRAALLTDLGLEYYHTAHYSLALEAWREAWALGQKATDAEGKFLADRAVCELASLYSRLGRMNELEALLKSVEHRVFLGGATERINIAREALAYMQYQPGGSFRCGPLALQSIQQSLNPQAPRDLDVFNSASTTQGISLAQVAELSKKVGLDYQMAFREKGGAFVVPSVVHWNVGHYAAMVRQVGDRYLVQDPTFGNTVWATKQALEAETSGYFLLPPGELPPGWRSVDAREGATIWGKGVTSGNDPDRYTCSDEHTSACGSEGCKGMAVSTVHLMLANLQVKDMPVGYTPPVGPPVWFTLRYNHRDYIQPPSLISSVFGPKWTHDWNSFIHDDPNSPLADVKYYVGGGGARTYTGFNTNTQTFAPQQYDQTLLKRIGTNPFTSTYEMIFPDGSKQVFGLRDSTGTLALTQVVDPAGNAVTLTWDTVYSAFRLVALTDAIGQVTTLTYDYLSQPLLITKVTDPFGRFATFDYVSVTMPIVIGGVTNFVQIPVLSKITDVLGLQSQFEYLPQSDIMTRMITPYGATTFLTGQGGGANGTTRFVETTYADGSRDRVEYNQDSNLGIPYTDPATSLPTGMACYDAYLYGRNTYYWSRSACATSYGDYTKAKIYHWLHMTDQISTSGIIESTRAALEGRVWYNYAGQAGGSQIVGLNKQPTRIGRVLDDGTTQLYTYAYDDFGHLTNSIDPIGRTLSFVYDTNGIDLLEVRQTRAGNNELLSRTTYNAQHRPLTAVDAAGQTNTFTYNARGQLLTSTNPRGETVMRTYDTNGYLLAVDGPLSGTNDVVTVTYDAFGRTRTRTDVSGYTLTFDYDALDRITRITHPDSTYEQFTYDRLDPVMLQDRAGRQTLFEYDNMRQIRKQTDPLGRVTLFDWCRCGAMKSLTDPIGRTTSWLTDVQGRRIGKQYGDGSQTTYVYENTSSRLKQVIDEKQQITQFTYNRDNTLKSIAYFNTAVPTPGVSYTYDTNYERGVSMTDGTGSTLFSYNPITGTPTLGAGQLASVDGPLPNDTITYGYDELGRATHRAINGVDSTLTYDAAWRVVGASNALGSFSYTYDGSSGRILSQTFPNGQTAAASYGGNLQDRSLERITDQAGVTPISEFIYGRDIPANRITTWSQQSGAQSPFLYTFGYDPANQLLSATVTNLGTLVNTFAYTYDPTGNRLTEQVGATNHTATYNALNQISTSTPSGVSRTNEWDAADRLTAVNAGNQRTEFTYDGFDRMVGIRQLLNGSEVSYRRLVWCGRNICEERDATGSVTKRFFGQGMKVESGPATGAFFYTRDHLGSIHELTDGSGTVRARYAYDPFGRRTRLTGDVDADFGFAGMFWAAEANLSLTHFRAYDPELGRWLSRDPLKNAEVKEGPNLYAYVVNDPVNRIDPDGLCLTTVDCTCRQQPQVCAMAGLAGGGGAAAGAIQNIAPAIPEAIPEALPCVETAMGYAPGWPASIPTIVGYAGGPGAEIEAALAQTAPALTANDPTMISTFETRLQSVRWFVATMDATRGYLDQLNATDEQAALDYIRHLDWVSRILFGL